MTHAAGRARRAATWLALAASLAAGLLFVVIHGTAPSDGARVAFYGNGWSAAGIRIAPIDAPAPGLQGGDLVRTVDGRSLDAWVRDALDPAVPRPGAAAAPVYELDRAGAPLSVAVPWAAPAVGATLLAGWSVILFSIASAGIAAYVFARRPGEPAATALILGACGAAGSSLAWFMGVTVSDVVLGGPFVFHALVTGPLYMLMWPAGIHLALVLPAPLPAVRRHRGLVPAVYVITLGAYGALTGAAWLASPTALDWVGTWPITQVAIAVPALIATIALFTRRALRDPEPAARARVRLASLGVLVSATLGLCLFMGPTLVLGRPLLPEAAIGLIALPLPLGFAAAILRDHLFDIDTAINRTLVYGGLTLGVVAIYAVGTSVASSLVGAEHGYGVSLLATGAAALLALPLRDALQRAVNRLMYGQRDEPWRAMRRLGTRLEWAADPERAFPAIAETVAEALRLPYVGVEVADEVGRSVVVAEHGSAGRSVEAVPLVHGAEPVGRLLLGVRAGDRGFRRDELALLQDLARQAGAAIHALRLRDDLARSRERLVVAREEERRRLRRDLHDGLGPTLAAIGMRAEAASTVMDHDPEAGRRQLDALGDEIRVALADVRRLVDGLRPPALDELGLLGAIGQQAARLDGGPEREAGVPAIRVEAVPGSLPDLPAAVEVAAYRITVEAMTNAVRHAGARLCRVRLEAGAQLTIEVTDDGRGLPVAPRAGTGIESMRERAAELGGDVVVERGPEGGTRVLARLPIGRVAPA
jgi:signal transduction histidine kinase